MPLVCRCVPVSLLQPVNLSVVLNLVCRFMDDQVLAPDFKEELANVAKIVQPFVRW